MQPVKVIVKNSFLYTSALIVQRVLSTLYFWYYSNTLINGAYDVGKLHYVLSFVALFFIIGDMGLYLVFVRECSKDNQKINSFINTVFTLKLPLLLIASCVILIAGYITQPENIFLIFLALIWIIVDNITMYIYALFRAHQNLFYESIGVVINQSIIIIVGVASLLLWNEVIYLVAALVIGTFVNFLYSFIMVKRKLGYVFRFTFDKKIARFFLASLPGFALSGVVVKILNSMDVIMIKQMLTDYEIIGLYSIPIKLINALSLTIPTALMGAVYPAFSRLYSTSKDSVSKICERSLQYLLIISVPTSFGFLSLGDEFLKGLWHNEYNQAEVPAKIMLFSLIFIFLAFPTGNMLNAIGKQKCTAISRCIGVVVLFAAEIILMKNFGLIGAAVALVITHSVIFFSDLIFLRILLRPVLKNIVIHALKIFFAAASMFAILELLSSKIWWGMLMIIGAAVYFIILLMIKEMQPSLFKHVRNVYEK